MVFRFLYPLVSIIFRGQYRRIRLRLTLVVNINSAKMMKENPALYPWQKSYPHNVNWSADIQGKPVASLLSETVKLYPKRPAFDFMDSHWSWGEIGDLVDRMAGGLQKRGVKKGTKVGLFLPNTPYFLIAYYAVLKIGGTVVNYNPLYAEREVKHQIQDSETTIMVTLDLKMMYDKLVKMLDETCLETLIICPFADLLPPIKKIAFSLFKKKDIAEVRTSERITMLKTVLAGGSGELKDIEINPDEDIAVLQYTGGTTGTPKGAMLTHTNVTANIEQVALWFHMADHGRQKMLAVLPFFHVFAMTAIMNFSVKAGFEIIATPRFDLDSTLKLIHKKRPHYFPAVPAIYNAINHHKKLGKYDLTSLKYCISGGAPLPVDVKKTFEAMTGCIVVEGYGLSESSPVAAINPIEGDNRAGSIGLPVPGTVFEIRNPDTGEIVPEKERGELCIAGPQVMKGYWKNDKATALTIRDGHLRTGDIAVMDDDGYFYIVDRIKDLIITNGYNVYPRTIEEAIYLHPAVEECIVAGLPDEQRGEIVKAWIKLKEGEELTKDTLNNFLKDKISKIEMPRKVEFRKDPLPKTMVGKLSRKDIVEEEKNKSKT